MSPEYIAQQRRRINRGVYGLLLLSVFAFTLVLVVIQSQHNEGELRETLASEYHQAMSKKGLELLAAIDASKLWFRDVELGRYELSAAQGNASLLSPLYGDTPVHDQISTLKYEISRLVGEMGTLQAHYADPEFEAISTTLENLHISVLADLDNMLLDHAVTHREIDDFVAPLIPIIHQLQRLHEHKYRDMRKSLDRFNQEKRFQLIGLIAALAVLGLFGVVRMVRHVHHAFSDLMIAQNHLRESEQYNRMLFEQSPMGLALCRMNGELVDINPAYARIIGRTIEETLTLSYWDITPESYAADEQHQLEHLHNTGRYGPYEKQYIHKDGHRVPVRLHGSIQVKGGEGFILSSIEDITEQKWAETELAKYREHLEELVSERTRKLQAAQGELVRKERLATLGQLTATVSHELRNPLGAMRPSLYIIEKNSDKRNERIQKAIERLDRSIDRCDRIVDELLDFTRITELNRRSVRIDEWLESVIDEQDIPGDIHVEKNLSLKDVELTIDTDRLRRAVINVVENACHAMLEEQHTLNIVKGSRLGIKTGGNDRRIEIAITDTGSGIPGDVQEKIFEPLFSTKSFGVGLGLPAVKQIMDQHGGGVDIETEAGQGSEITLWLPRDAAGLDDEEVAA